ncbi:MAG: ribonuclease Z, partial [Candidatus Micrarchaeota archaeon]|nr:ribonuclease Z [Candidatus Micrarchaeota archaeon]
MIRLVCLGSSAAQPTSRSVPSHFAVKFGGVWLFDCAEGCQRQMMKYNVPYGQVSAIFLTHLHADHVLGLAGLVQTLNMTERKEALPIFGPPGTKAFLETLFSLANFAPDFRIAPFEVSHTEKTVCVDEKLFQIRSFPVNHSTKAVGYVLEEKAKTKFHEEKAKAMGIKGRLFTQIMEKGKIKVGDRTISLKEVTFQESGKKIVLTGDTEPCASVVENARGANVLVHEATFDEKQKAKARKTRHSTALEAGKQAKAADVKKLILTHFGNRYEDRRKLV